MKRRDLFRTGSIALAGALAGCAGLLGQRDAETPTPSTTTARTTAATTSEATETPTTTSRAASFAVELSAPEETRVRDTFSVQVTATNTGGQSGTLTDTLRARGPQESTREVEVGPVPAGERATTRVELVPEYAGTYELGLRDRDVSLSIDVVPVTDLDASIPVGEDLLLSPESVEVVGATFVEGPGRPFAAPPVTSLVGAEPEGTDDYFLALFTATVENTGNTARTFDPSVVGVDTQGTDPALHTTGQTLQGTEYAEARLPDGRPSLVGARIPPGERVEGFLLAPLTRSDARNPLAVTVQRDGDGPAEATWSATPTTRSLPRFEVRSLDVPDQVEVNESNEFSVEVTNAGDATGTFRGTLEDPIDAEEGKYTTLGTVQERIPPGETRTLSGSMVLPWHRKPRDDDRVRFRPGGITRTVRTEPARRAYGETFTLVNGVTVTVMAPTYSDTIDYGRGNESHGFWTVAVTAELPEAEIGEDRGSELLPSADEFRCYRSNGEFEYVNPYRVVFPSVAETVRDHNNTIEAPVRGQLYPITPPDNPDNGQIGGWLSFRIGDGEERFPTNRLEVQLIRWIYGRTDRSMASWSEKF